MRSAPFLLTALAAGLAPSAVPSQSPVEGPSSTPPARTAAADLDGVPVPGSYLVRFAERSFDLEPLRLAISARDRERADAIVTDLESRVFADQRAFVDAVTALGGVVTHQWWIVNGACVEGVEPDRLRALDGVAFVEPNRYRVPLNNTARNTSNHDAVTAETRLNAAGENVRGQGLAVAVLDTGIDVDFQGSGLPNPALYPGGAQANATGPGLSGSRLLAALSVTAASPGAFQNHGTHVAGIVGSDYSGYVGLARGTSIVSINVSIDDTTGNATSASLASAWQLITQQRLLYGIAVANNSYSGSPNLNSTAQVALDNAARIGDIAIAVAAGNNGGDTTSSQNGWNGLAVGAIKKNSWNVAGFSARGPLDNFGRTYPDIAGIGVNVQSMKRDDISGTGASGTSMASPMVAGGLALVRSAAPEIGAAEAKAVLLNTTRGVQNDRNKYGLGVLDCDAAVQQALAGDWYTTLLSAAAPVRSRTFTVSATTDLDLTAAWMRGGTASSNPPPNVDLRVRDAGGNVVASDVEPLNSYAHVDFTAQAGIVYTLELEWLNGTGNQTLDVAVSGLAETPLAAPTLGTLSDTVVEQAATNALLTVTGTELDRSDAIELDGVPTGTLQPLSATQARWTLPRPLPLGSHTVTVRNAAGVSNGLVLDVVAPTDPVLLPSIGATPEGDAAEFTLYGRATDLSVFLLSPFDVPSVAPGLVDLGIGANFTALVTLANLTHDPDLGTASLTLPLPPLPAGVFPLFVQTISIDTAAPVLPFRTSDVAQHYFVGY